ncbi:hypothetical protein FB446DRAFT_761112 [Lentinula raphanica]|nr:hypothetical protein FB446DRAFT_761112 [Lentinula raphanica]
MIVLSHSKIVMLLILAGMISVLALPVQDGTIHSPSSSTGKNVQDENSKSLEVQEETDKDLQLPPLWQVGAEGPQHTTDRLPRVPFLPARDPGPPVAFPPGFKEVTWKYQRRDVYEYGNEETFRKKIKAIKGRNSWVQKVLPSRDRRRKFNSLYTRLMKTSEDAVDDEDKKLVNTYNILLWPRTEEVIKSQIEWIKEHLEKEPQFFQLKLSDYQAIFDRLENFQPEPNDMINIGLADPKHDGTCYLPEFGWYTDISQEGEEARAQVREAYRVRVAKYEADKRKARKAELVSAETRQLLAKLTRGKSNSEASGSSRTSR